MGLGIRMSARLFIRGSRLPDAVQACRRLSARGRANTLGYFNTDSESPRSVADSSLAALDALAGLGPGGYLSIKAPALGFDAELIGEIVDRAVRGSVGIHFDSHEIDQADATFVAIRTALDRFNRQRVAEADGSRDGSRFVGYSLPGRWTRSLDDADRIIELGIRPRVVKGQWGDPAEPGIDSRAGFLAVIDRLAGRARAVGVATHDPPLAEEALRRLARAGTPYELELLQGLPMNGVLRVARKIGAPVRIYVPFGVAWVPYALEQIRKRPYLVGWVIRDAILGRFIDQPPLALR